MGRAFCHNGHTSHQSEKAARACDAKGQTYEVQVAVVVTVRVVAKDNVHAMKTALETTQARCRAAKLRRVQFGNVRTVTELG